MTARTVLPPTYLLLGIVTIAALHFLLPVGHILVLPWRLVDLLPLLLGLALNLAADRQFKQAKTTVKPFQRSSALITNGAYRIHRHPMSLGFVLILASVPICLSCVLFLLYVTHLPLGATVIIGVLVVVAATVNDGVLLLTYAGEIQDRQIPDAARGHRRCREDTPATTRHDSRDDYDRISAAGVESEGRWRYAPTHGGRSDRRSGDGDPAGPVPDAVYVRALHSRPPRHDRNLGLTAVALI